MSIIVCTLLRKKKNLMITYNFLRSNKEHNRNMIAKNKKKLQEMIKQLNTKGREKSLNQTLLAYIDLCVSKFIYCLLFEIFFNFSNCFRYVVVS